MTAFQLLQIFLLNQFLLRLYNMACSFNIILFFGESKLPELYLAISNFNFIKLKFFYDFEYLIIFYGFVYLIFELLFKVLSKDLNKNETGVFEFLNTLPISNVLFSHYHASGGMEVLYETNHKILFSFVAGENEKKKFENNYPSKTLLK